MARWIPFSSSSGLITRLRLLFAKDYDLRKCPFWPLYSRFSTRPIRRVLTDGSTVEMPLDDYRTFDLDHFPDEIPPLGQVEQRRLWFQSSPEYDPAAIATQPSVFDDRNMKDYLRMGSLHSSNRTQRLQF